MIKIGTEPKVVLSGKCELRDRELPIEYQRLEYLESTGEQYIDTSYCPNSTDIRITTKILVNGYSTVNQYTNIFYAFTGEKARAYRLLWDNQNSNIIVTNNNSPQNSNVFLSGILSNTPLLLNVDLGVSMYKINDIQGTYPDKQITVSNNTKTLFVFAKGFIGAFYNFKVYDNDIIVLNLIPARRKSDSVLGMYDTVTDTFFTNAGTGTFIAGPDITEPSPDNPMDIWCNNGKLKVDAQGNVYVEGETETVTDNLGNTATAERLLGLDDIVDKQNVPTGEVTRNIGVIVLDGSESWQLQGGTNSYLFYIFKRTLATNYILSNTFRTCVINTSSTNIGIDAVYKSSYGQCLAIRDTVYTEVESLKQYLSDQYNAGNPVIVVFPLTNPTTEQVQPQELTGDTVTQTSGSIDNLPIERVTDTEVKKRYIGDKEVKKVYVGTKKVFEKV